MNADLITKRSGGSLESRLKALEELTTFNKPPLHHLNEQERDKFYSHVFSNTLDLLDPTVPNDIRQRVWRVYTQLIDGQAKTIEHLRFNLFDVIANYEAREEDILYLIDFLMALTDHGKTVTYYESKIGIFIIKWIETLFEKTDSRGCLQVKKYNSLVEKKFLKFLINLIKYNAACIASDNPKALIKMLRYVCALAYQSESISELNLIYEFLNVVLSYSHLPNETLSQFVVILCIGVNREELFATCNKIMKNLIGTYLGFACFTTLHHIIEDEINFRDKLLIRGAVYFLVQILWGDMMNEKAAISANVVLSAFQNNDIIASPHIALEIANGIYIFISSSIQEHQQQQQQNNHHIQSTNVIQNRPSSKSMEHHQQTKQPKDEFQILSMKSNEIVYQYTWDLVLNVCDILVSKHLLLIVPTTPTPPPTQKSCKTLDSGTGELRTVILSILKLLEKLLDDRNDNLELNPTTTDLYLNDRNLSTPSSSTLLFLLDDSFMEKIFSIFEMARDHLSNETVYNLIERRLNYINRFKFDLDDKLKKLKQVIVVYFISNTNNEQRMKVLKYLEKFLDECTFIDVDIFWDKVASNFFSTSDKNSTRELPIIFLLYLAKKSRSNKNLNDFIEIFDMTVHNRLKMYQRHHSTTMESVHHLKGTQIPHQNSAPVTHEVSIFDDAIQSIDGLIAIFSENICHYECHTAAVNAFRSLVKVLTFIQRLHGHFGTDDGTHHHYHHNHHHHSTNSSYIRTLSSIKSKLFHTVLSLRTNRWAQLGVVDNTPSASTSPSSYYEHLSLSPQQFAKNDVEECVRFTPYILVRDLQFVSTNAVPPSSTANASLNNITNNYNQNSPPTSPQHQQQQQMQTSAGTNSPISNTSSSFHCAFIDSLKLVIESIQHEKDWSVLNLIFVELPKTLKHKGLILAATSSSSSAHSTPYSSMTHLSNKNESIPDLIVNILYHFIDTIQSRFNEMLFGDAKVNKVDILAHIYNSISALVGYKLLSSSQTSIVKCLQKGLIQFSSKISCLRQCIVSLTICSIEMQTTMNKYLQDIIIQLSKITTNKALAVPKLEFLSNIILFPDIYYTFTNKQYLSIFMIAQSYINPYKYGEYTVALALRVISMWFLKCPIACRMNLVQFLMKGFQNNILKEVEPTTAMAAQLSQRLTNNDPNANRQHKIENRLSLGLSPPPPPSTPLSHSVFSFQSFNSQCNTDQHALQQQFALSSSSSAFNAVPGKQLGVDSVILDPNDKENSKIELVEVCMDMLASNAYTTSSPLPLRPSMIDKLLNKDKSQFWMIGHKIIQITTTGCTSRAMRYGLCNKCYTICHMNKPMMMIQQPPTPSSSSSEHYPQPHQPHNSFPSLTNQWNEKLNSCNQFGYMDFNHSTNHSQNSCHSGNVNHFGHNQTANNARRRHRSEINHSTKMKNANFTHDDYFMSRQHPIGSSSDSSDLNSVSKYCRCWCQTWAEILIRRATGTTRIILRVENNLGDFPNWTSSKEEDDSLAQIFKNSNPDLNLALKMQKCSESMENIGVHTGDEISSSEVDCSPQDSLNESSSLSNSGTISSVVEQQIKAKTSQPVTRAASFGSRPLQAHNNLTMANDSKGTDAHEMARSHVIRKLEKDFSFEENTPEGSQSSLASSIGENNLAHVDNYGHHHHHHPHNMMFRDRGYTISVMTSVQKSSSSTSVVNGHPNTESSMSASNINLSSRQPISPVGLSPQFVFLQLYYNSMFRDPEFNDGSVEKPIQLERSEALERSLGTFDRTTPYETHKIGVLYVGPGQTNSRSEILANQIGSFRYANFLKNLGQLISLRDIDNKVFYVGGLGEEDGPYAISWCDHLVQMIFHVATLMPTLPNDPNCNKKMAHIGNDLVCIIYNNSGEKIDLTLLRDIFGQVLQAFIMITPLEYESNIVELQSKKEFAEFIGHTESQILSDEALPVYARQFALHANLGAMVYNPKQEMRSYHISNWLSRLRNIKRLRARAIEKQQPQQNDGTSAGGLHSVRSSVSSSGGPPSAPIIGTGVGSNSRTLRQSQSSLNSKIDDSEIGGPNTSSSSAISPNPYNSTGSINNSAYAQTSSNSISGSASASIGSGVFDYDGLTTSNTTQQRLAFPDFTEYTKDS